MTSRNSSRPRLHKVPCPEPLVGSAMLSNDHLLGSIQWPAQAFGELGVVKKPDLVFLSVPSADTLGIEGLDDLPPADAILILFP